MFVHGDSLKSCVVAVIVPHQAEITEWALRRGVQADSFTGLCSSRQVSTTSIITLLRFPFYK